MKFGTAAAFTLAFAAGAQASLIPLAHSHLAVSAPLHLVSAAHHHHPGSLAVHASTADWGHHHGGSVAVHASAAHHGWAGHHGAVVVDAHHAPSLVVGGHHGSAIVVDSHHAHVHAPIVVAHGHEGQYVAKTRGAVHSAPLAGHAASAASINLQPAPGTI